MPKKLKTPRKTICQRRTILQPADWWPVIEAEAKLEGMSLSEFMGARTLSTIQAEKTARLSARPLASRPRKNGVQREKAKQNG
jgi:hypothetical protein